MDRLLKNVLSSREFTTLSSIIHVGDAAYKELVGSGRPMFAHPYFADTKGRIRTKLVQMQCEIESHDSNFPFGFSEREFPHGQIIPELRSKDFIIHIARTNGPGTLPSPSKYKKVLSHNNAPLVRQLAFDFTSTPTTIDYGPFYGILAFGGKRELFSVLQFPNPGFGSIADHINIPQIIIVEESDDAKSFERKKAKLKSEFLAHGMEEDIV